MRNQGEDRYGQPYQANNSIRENFGEDMNSRTLVIALIISLLLGALPPQEAARAQDAPPQTETYMEVSQLPENVQAAEAQVPTEIYVEPTSVRIIEGTNEICKTWDLDNHLNVPALWDEYQWAGAHTGGVAYRDNAGDGAELTFIFRLQEDQSPPTRASVNYWRYESTTVAGGALVIELLIAGQPSGWGYFNPSGSIGTTINLINGSVVADRLSFDGIKVYARPEPNHLAIVGWDALHIEKCYQGVTPTATAIPPTPTETATNTPLPTATNTPLPPPTATALPTATDTPIPLPTATNTALPTATSTPLSLPSPTPTGVIVTPIIPTPTATAITVTLPITTSQVGVITTTVAGCNRLYLPLIRMYRRFGTEVEAASTAVTTTVQASQCLAVPLAVASVCPGGWTMDWAVYIDGRPEFEYGRRMTCKNNPEIQNGPVLVTIMEQASMKVDPKHAIIAILAGLIPYTVNAVWSSYDTGNAIGPNQFVIMNPVLVDEWFSGQLAQGPTGLYYGRTLRVDQYPAGHVKYFTLPAFWPTTIRIVKAETAKITADVTNLALVQHKMDKQVYSFLIQTTTATDGELVTEASGSAAQIVNRVWREAIRANNAKILAAPEKFFSLYKSWTAGSVDNGVDVELYLAAPSNLSSYVVIPASYAVVAGDLTLDQSLKLWGAIKIGGSGRQKVTAYSIFLTSEWYDKEDTYKVPTFSYRPIFLAEAHTGLQELTDMLGVFAATVLDRVEAARTETLARIKTKRDKCWERGRYWDEAAEVCRKSRPLPGDKTDRAPNEDKEPDMPDRDKDRYYPIVPEPAKDPNSWGHCRKTRGWVWCDDTSDAINAGETWWRFIGYTRQSGDAADPGAHAAFVLHFDQPHEIDREMIDKICVVYKFAEEPGGGGYWYIATAIPYKSDNGCLKPLNNIIDSTDRFSPPKR